MLWRKNSGTSWDRWYVLYKGYAEDGWGLAGADKLVDVVTTVDYLKPHLDSVPTTLFYDQCGAYYDPAWDTAIGTGRHYDGATEFPVFPHRYHSYSAFNVAGHTVQVADLPMTRDVVHEAWCNFIDDTISLNQSAYVLERGMILGVTSHNPSTAGWGDGDGLGFDVNIKRVLLRYFNACANSLSRYTGPSAGGWPLVLSGLGFANADVELNENSGPYNGHAWGDTIYRIYIEKPDGAVAATLIPTLPHSHFTVDSNTQITIPSMPALASGVYQIRFHKRPNGVDVYSYAGDWRTDPDGRMTPGRRLYIMIGDPGPRDPVITTKWVWKKGDLTVFKYYAPIDVRSTATFWEGMVLGVSPFTRGVNDLSGLPLLPDLEIELDNTSREFSKLLAQYWCKNQLVEVWWGYQGDPWAFHELVFSGIVSDYDRPGSTWKVRLRSIMEKYFAAKIPKYRCTVEEYPNIHENHIGREMPEVLGLASLTEGSAPGAVEAIYINTATYKYLAARGSLLEVLEVYSDGVLKTETTDYTISYEDGGRTYLTFVADQGDAKVTYNAKGYTYPDWDSAGSDGGFVQNQAYIILFLLAFFAEVPDICVDIPAFDTLAATYDDLGFGTNGYLIIQHEKDVAAYLQELLFTYGAKLWVTADNKITIARKDATDFATSVHYFEQIDALDEPQRPQGFASAVNYAPVRWRHYPHANAFIGTKVASRQSSIDAFEAAMSPGQAWDMPWTDSEDLVDLRTTEELLKLGFGDQKIILPLSLEHVDELDILDNFRYQDPFGLNATGDIEYGHYYYVESIGFDLMAGRWTLTGVDAQWMLRQMLILGDSSVLAANWSAATEAERIYTYLADSLTCSFADGEPGKVFIDCGG